MISLGWVTIYWRLFDWAGIGRPHRMLAWTGRGGQTGNTVRSAPFCRTDAAWCVEVQFAQLFFFVQGDVLTGCTP